LQREVELLRQLHQRDEELLRYQRQEIATLREEFAATRVELRAGLDHLGSCLVWFLGQEQLLEEWGDHVAGNPA